MSDKKEEEEIKVWECDFFKLDPVLKKLLLAVRKKRAFNVKEWIEEKCKMFNAYMKKCGLKACAINCSGGIDSAATVALCYHASKMKDSPIQKIYGIAQPIKSTAKIQNRAFELKPMVTDVITIDQSDIFDDLWKVCEKAIKIEGKQFVRGQLKSYMRTPVAYYVAQLIGQSGFPCVVMGTGNFDEDGYLYYFCKAGDGIADIQLINELHKSEVFAVAKELKVPKSILAAAPSADLWDGQTDEGEIGTSYDAVEMYVEWLNMDKEEREKIVKGFGKETKKQWDFIAKTLSTIHRRNSHKESYPLNINIKKYELSKHKK